MRDRDRDKEEGMEIKTQTLVSKLVPGAGAGALGG